MSNVAYVNFHMLICAHYTNVCNTNNNSRFCRKIAKNRDFFSHLIFVFFSGDMQKMTTFDIVVACSKIKVLVRAQRIAQARTQGGESDES